MKKLRLSVTQSQVAILTVIAFSLSLVPLLVIGLFNHPSMDDFTYSLPVMEALRQGGSALAVLEAAARNVGSTFFTWQGTYSAIFLFALQPAVFHESLYMLTTPIMLASLITGTAVFLHVLCVKCLKMQRSSVVILTCAVLFLCVQCLPSPLQAFFWYNGSVFYTFFYGVMLLMLSGIISQLFSARTKMGWPSLIAVPVLAVVLGGANLATGLLCAVLLPCLCLYTAAFRKKRPLYLRLWLYGSTLLFLAGFALNILAPGNAIRQTYFDEPSAPRAVVSALRSACAFSMEWAQHPLVLPAMLFITPLLYQAAAEVKFSFPLPGLAPVLSVILVAIQLTPSAYAQNNTGPLRQKNIIFYLYILLMAFCIYYACGWISHRLAPMGRSQLAQAQERFAKVRLWFYGTAAAAACVLLLCSPVLAKTTSVSAVLSLKRGEAQAYDRQVRERLAVLNDPTMPDVVLEPLEYAPYLLFRADLSAGKVKEYYGKNSVTLEKTVPTTQD